MDNAGFDGIVDCPAKNQDLPLTTVWHYATNDCLAIDDCWYDDG